jgi:hypothetical protein
MGIGRNISAIVPRRILFSSAEPTIAETQPNNMRRKGMIWARCEIRFQEMGYVAMGISIDHISLLTTYLTVMGAGGE